MLAGSSAGAARLLNNNTGVQSEAQKGQKPFVAEKTKSFIDLWLSVRVRDVKACSSDPLPNNALLRSNYIKQAMVEVSEKLP